MSDENLRKLYCKIGVFGLSDLRKLAPIGDLGYLNDTSYYRGKDFFRSTMIGWIMTAFHEQREKFGFKVDGGNTVWRCTDHWSGCDELGLYWQVDSGD